MRIVIDMQGAQTESRHRGIGRYTLLLAKAMARQRGENEIVLALSGCFPAAIEPIRAAFAGLLPQENIKVWYVPEPLKACHRDNQWRGLAAQSIRESFFTSLAPDVVFVTSVFEGYHDDAVTSIGEYAPGLTTVAMLYDLIPLIHATTYLEHNSAYKHFFHAKLRQLKKASAWLTISESARQEALKYLQLDPLALTNIGAACDPIFRRLSIAAHDRASLLRIYNITRPFILYSGGADARKNLSRLIRVFVSLPPALREQYQLVMVGKMTETDTQGFLEITKKAGLAPGEVTFTGNVSDDHLCQLYNLCHAFVFPSLHEGFGLPVLEAMSCGVPVISSNTTSMPEVVGMADALFDPLSEPDMLQKLLQVLTDVAFRQKLISHGARQALSYSWEQTARYALDAIERVVSTSPNMLASSAATSHIAGQSELQSVVQAIARLPGRYTDLDLRQCAATLSLNHPQVRTSRIYVDVSELVKRDAFTGVQRVTKNILAYLLKAPPAGYTVEAVYGSAHDYGYRCARRFAERFMGRPADGDDTLIEPRSGDVFLGLDLQHHITQLQSPYLQELRGRGVAVHFVVYDLLPIQFPNYWPSLHALHVQWLYTLAQFDGAICISRTVADELLDWLNQHGPNRLRPFSIGWFHLGADIESSAPSRGLPPDAVSVLQTLATRPTFLVVGTLEPRKGHAKTLAAFEQLWREGLDINLVFVGKSGWLVEALVEKLRVHPELGRHFFWLTSVSDEFLVKIYAAANCLIAPSEGEGFGLPLIEAAQHGLPIIASDIPVFREVAGDHATYFRGKTPEAMAQAVRDWLQLDQSTAQAQVAGMPWLTWEQSALQLQNVMCQNNWLYQWPPTLTSNPDHAA